jgi:GntR family transcriptional regulator
MSETPPLPAPAFFNPFPKYLQVRQIIERRLYGHCEIGDKLPTEQALCAEFGVSRETVREALRGLEEDGVIRRYRAKGTFFVHRPSMPERTSMVGMVEDSSPKSRSYAALLAAGPVKPPEDVIAALGTAPDVYLIERLYHLEDQPLALHESYLPRAVAERILEFDLTCSRLLEVIKARLDTPCIEERQQIDAMVADARLARLLDIAVGAPVLKITRLYRLGEQAPHALFHSYYRADRYTYTLEINPAR